MVLSASYCFEVKIVNTVLPHRDIELKDCIVQFLDSHSYVCTENGMLFYPYGIWNQHLVFATVSQYITNNA